MLEVAFFAAILFLVGFRFSHGSGPLRRRTHVAGKGRACHTICPKQTKRKNAFSHIYANGCTFFLEYQIDLHAL
jgi:hypothetical protein